MIRACERKIDLYKCKILRSLNLKIFKTRRLYDAKNVFFGFKGIYKMTEVEYLFFSTTHFCRKDWILLDTIVFQHKKETVVS